MRIQADRQWLTVIFRCDFTHHCIPDHFFCFGNKQIVSRRKAFPAREILCPVRCTFFRSYPIQTLVWHPTSKGLVGSADKNPSQRRTIVYSRMPNLYFFHCCPSANPGFVNWSRVSPATCCL